MKIYNKPFSPLNTAVINLVWVNVLAFLFVSIIKLFPFGNFVFNFLSFWPSKPLWASLHSMVTSIFIHDGFFHILGNMLWLFFIGTILEDLIGKKHIYKLYFGGGIAGIFLFYFISKLTGNFIPIVGASAGISAIILATAIFTPHYRIFLFGIVEIEIRWIVIIKVFLDFLGMFGGSNSGGNQAHIGGYLFGLAYILFIKGIWNFPTNWIPKKSSKPKRSAQVHINRQSPSQEEIDKILDKISESGYDNLTAKEKRVSFQSKQKISALKILLKIFNLLIFPLTLIFGLLLSISGQVPSVPPSYSSYVPLLGLAFPVLYAINILFLIYWLIQVKWSSLIPATFLFINMGQMSLYFQWNAAKDFPIQEESKLKVVSYNANSFGQWTDNYSLDTITEKLKDLHADVYLIQEAYSPKNQLTNLCRKLGKDLKTPYTAVYQLTNNRGYGMCILSKFPITDWKKIKFLDQTGNMAMSADIKVPSINCLECGDEKIRLYNIHLQSFRFNKQDYQTVKTVKDSNQIDEENAMGLIQRIRIAYEKREHQVDIVSREIQDCKLPKIVAGDFNDVPVSYTYRNVSKGLNDAFIIRGKGLETTYKGVFPSFRIDYILYSDPLQAETYRSISNIPGDHKLILAEFDRNDLFEP